MKHTLILILTLSITITTSAQDKGKFSCEFGYGTGQVAMCKLNQYYIDSLAKPQKQFKDDIKMANHGFACVRYQPGNLFDIGFFGSMMQSEIKSNPAFYSSDEVGNTNSNQGSSSLLVQSLGYGITTNIHINQMLKWQEKQSTFLKRCRLLTEVRVGSSISSAIININFPTLPIANTYSRYHTNDFDGQIALKLEYDFFKCSMLSGLGLRVGYNYSNTKTMKDQYSEEWKVLNGKAINLNFSGWFASIYLVFAK
jgi:hypothetical protein